MNGQGSTSWEVSCALTVCIAKIDRIIVAMRIMDIAFANVFLFNNFLLSPNFYAIFAWNSVLVNYYI